MKSKTVFLFLAVVSLISHLGYADFLDDNPNEPKTFLMPPERVYSPPGFDSNDNVQLVITGHLPSTCFRMGATTAEVDHSTKTITIHNQAYYYAHSWCATVLVPFIKTIEVGILEAGEYKVQAENWHGSFITGENLPIQISKNSGPDDFLYAIIDDVRFKKDDVDGSSITVSGSLAGRCMELDRIDVLYRAKNIIEVLPIAKIKGQDQKGCEHEHVAFERKVSIQSPWKGKVLIHVRSLNGQSINKEVDL